MKVKGIRCVRAAAAFLAFVTTCASNEIWARTPNIHPARQQIVRATRPLARGRPLGPHHFFGTILAIRGGMLSVRRRNGMLVTVDASQAIASDNYSYPLFVGKTIAVDGRYLPKTFLATHVNAVTSLRSLKTDS